MTDVLERMKAARLVYLATPYSKFPGGIEAGFIASAKVTARLIEAGVRVYSPIAHTHPVAIHGGLDPLDHSLWLPFDEAMMEAADMACVAMLPTWEASFGVQQEIQHFTAAGKPVLYLECEGWA